MLRSLLPLVAALAGSPAQSPPVAPPPAPVEQAQPAERPLVIDTRVTVPQAPAVDNRPCPGCPPRRLGRAFWQVTVVNVFYEMANLIRGQDTAKITPSTWWENMRRGWEWDLDDFVVNQIGHPYQGNNYFTVGRSNGLNFWESAAMTAFGSGTWEFFGETNQASLNDFINTTLGGIALGEMFHRTAWLVRDPTKTGKGRLWSEIGATVIDPMTGLNRFISGDSERVTAKPPEMVPEKLSAEAWMGALWRGSNTDSVESDTFPFLQLNVVYGNPVTMHSRTPYDAFSVRLDIGGGSALSEANVRGRLFAEGYRGGQTRLSVSQGYQFSANDAYRFGAQSFEVNLSFESAATSRTSFWAAGWGGVTVLGAVDSLPFGVTEVPEEHEDPEGESPGQGVSTGPRFYDYGPGTNFGAFFSLRRDGRPFFTLAYEAHHLYVLDGVRANHLLQRGRADLKVPIKGRIGVGVAAEFFDRRTFYQTPGTTPARFQFPQFRAFLTWTGS